MPDRRYHTLLQDITAALDAIGAPGKGKDVCERIRLLDRAAFNEGVQTAADLCRRIENDGGPHGRYIADRLEGLKR